MELAPALHPATIDDTLFVLEVRNDESVREYTAGEKTNEEKHIPYFYEHYNEFRIICFNGEKIGYIRKKQDGIISIALFGKFQKYGIGQWILARETGKANILVDNLWSLRCFQNSGFKITSYNLEKKKEGITGN